MYANWKLYKMLEIIFYDGIQKSFYFQCQISIFKLYTYLVTTMLNSIKVKEWFSFEKDLVLKYGEMQ